jgi:hypothetical protein
MEQAPVRRGDTARRSESRAMASSPSRGRGGTLRCLRPGQRGVCPRRQRLKGSSKRGWHLNRRHHRDHRNHPDVHVEPDRRNHHRPHRAARFWRLRAGALVLGRRPPSLRPWTLRPPKERAQSFGVGEPMERPVRAGETSRFPQTPSTGPLRGQAAARPPPRAPSFGARHRKLEAAAPAGPSPAPPANRTSRLFATSVASPEPHKLLPR